MWKNLEKFAGQYYLSNPKLRKFPMPKKLQRRLQILNLPCKSKRNAGNAFIVP